MNVRRINRHLRPSDIFPVFLVGVSVMMAVAFAAERVLKQEPRDTIRAAGIHCER